MFVVYLGTSAPCSFELEEADDIVVVVVLELAGGREDKENQTVVDQCSEVKLGY
jgi:hypothetical protein